MDGWTTQLPKSNLPTAKPGVGFDRMRCFGHPDYCIKPEVSLYRGEVLTGDLPYIQ